ncbi:thioredoxin family protein [Amaricoccus sp.]|uniref:thioredoxin family protein n=1 Tax=Amaricoccus sp. TaxID=1872485 RepID=UPI001B55C691|nr:thioredoxin family protein [Amaricoccus sp.]MBP7000145.1 thioredoxin family protein [Amaricoccus sp.]
MAAIPPVCDFGLPAPDFVLPDTEGRLRTRDEVRGPNGLLVVFICNHCPYVKAIADKLAAEGRALAALGVGVVAINSNDSTDRPEDAPGRMGPFARAHGFPFPYLHDATQGVARAYGAVCTPDFFGYDAALGLQYRGRLDASGREARADAPRELYAAMAQIAATGRGPADQTASIGCSIKWKA